MNRCLYTFACGILTLQLSTSCGIEYRDRPVEFDGDEHETVYGEDASIIPGRYEEQLFVAIESGDPIYIIHGFQGGTWVHLSIRVNAMPTSGEISAVIALDNATEIATISYNLKLVRTAEGYLEAYDIPIPMPEDDATLSSLIGQAATLTVTYRSDVYEVSASHDVVLEAG